MSSGLTKHVLHITTVKLFIYVTDGSKFFIVTLGKNQTFLLSSLNICEDCCIRK